MNTKLRNHKYKPFKQVKRLAVKYISHARISKQATYYKAFCYWESQNIRVDSAWHQSIAQGSFCLGLCGGVQKDLSGLCLGLMFGTIE